ncbi:PP2C family protein-serine/threonine phosphatase [Novipirellula galeiformis]|nr:protein phosphatase 2C domain-containing protein [Novipirellula galeiformis]
MLSTITETSLDFCIESDMRDPRLHPMPLGSVVSISRRCPGKIEPNDDSSMVIRTSSGAIVMAVADGVGGCPLGYKASAIAVHCIAEMVGASDPDADLRPAILDGIEKANTEILDLGVGAATTLSVVEIVEGRVRAYTVGDSMTMIVGQRGSLKWKSTSHSPVGYAIESGMLDEAAAMTHDDRHVVSNLVGSKTMHIEVGPSRQLAARDRVILASDGLFDNLHLSEVVAAMKSGKPIGCMQKLVQIASQRMSGNEEQLPGKPDDLTILLYAR